ncbi:MAG: aldose 1-epimerase family protein [Sciscionella sp.]
MDSRMDAGGGRLSRRAALGGALATGAAVTVAGRADAATRSTGPARGRGPNGRVYELRRGGQRAVVAGVAATLLSWRVDGEELLFTHAADVLGESGYAGKTLLPWCNRIDHGRYTFDGSELQVPINEPSRDTALHGLMNFVEWDLVSHSSNRVVLEYVQPPSYGYPFQMAFRIEYTVDSTGVGAVLTASNIGSRRAPFSTATHVYIAAPPGKRVDDITLTLPAKHYYLTNDRLIPTGKAKVGGTPYDFMTARPIGETKMDTAFVDVLLGSNRESTALLRRPGSADVELWMDEKHNYYQLYTDDSPSVRRPTRQGLAIEPMTAAPNAFATGDGLIVIEPGEQHSSRWGLRSG